MTGEPAETVSNPFTLTYGSSGCGRCSDDLYEGDQVAFVGNVLICAKCADAIILSTAIGRKAARSKTREVEPDSVHDR